MNYLEDVDLAHPDLADLYDELPLWSAPFGLRMLDRVALRPGLTILDVGAGTGFLSVELAQRCGPTARVIAVDPWAGALRRLRRKLEYLGLANVRVLEQDAAHVELPDASVDLVVSNLGMNNFANAQDVLRMCARAMRPEARLFLTTNLRGHMAELYAVYADVLREARAPGALEALAAHVEQRGSVDSVSRVLREAGLEVVGAETDGFRMRFADGSALLRHHFVRLAFVPGWKSLVSPELRPEIFARLERALDAHAAKHGELSLTIPMACIEARRRDPG